MLKCALLSSYFSFQTISHSSVKQSNTLYLITVIYIYINIIAPLHGFVLACGVKVLARFCTIGSCATLCLQAAGGIGTYKSNLQHAFFTEIGSQSLGLPLWLGMEIGTVMQLSQN